MKVKRATAKKVLLPEARIPVIERITRGRNMDRRRRKINVKIKTNEDAVPAIIIFFDSSLSTISVQEKVLKKGKGPSSNNMITRETQSTTR